MKPILLAAAAVLLPVAAHAQSTTPMADPATTGSTMGTMSEPSTTTTTTTTTPATDSMTTPSTGTTYGTTGTGSATSTYDSSTSSTSTGSTYGNSAAASTSSRADVSAPDGSRAFGIEPYVGVFGGYHDFDKGNKGALQLGNSANGWLAGGYAGVNIPLGPLVVGAEGNIAKGFNDIDYEYGVTGHVGIRVGESGMFFGRAGYHWVEAKRGFRDDRNEIYGFGVEVGPQDIGLGGITGESGVRIRFAIDTFDVFQSIRPQVGLTFHF